MSGGQASSSMRLRKGRSHQKALPAKPLLSSGTAHLLAVPILLCFVFFWQFLGAHKSYNHFNFSAHGAELHRLPMSLLTEAAT